MIMREVDRIDELIKSFWQPAINRALFDIHHCLQEAAELLESEAADIRVQRDYDPSIPPISGDPSAFRQLFINLLRNAEQAGARNLLIKTRVEHGSALLEEGRGTVVRIDLEDDGEGVPVKLRPLLFLPMVSGRRAGTGLGLALVQQIAADHGGLVTFEPLEAHETGSRFSVHLPFCLDPEAGVNPDDGTDGATRQDEPPEGQPPS
jgi:two-component system nitrogen regulation sensor histidine kinase GlnL